MNIHVPAFSLVLLVGPTASGKSTFARQHFSNTEIVSSDHYRGVVTDDPTDQSATEQAFELVHSIVAMRLKNRRLTVVDATNLQDHARRPLLQLAHRHDCPIAAIVFQTPLNTCIERNEARTDRNIPNGVVHRQYRNMRGIERSLRKQHIRNVHVFKTAEQPDDSQVIRRPLDGYLPDNHGPFDVIGDIHGCHQELFMLLGKLGYVETLSDTGWNYHHPEGRTAVFVGDLVDRGPGSDQVLETVMNMVDTKNALCVLGNHEDKLLRTLRGNPTKIAHGLQETLDQLDRRPEALRERVKDFLNGLPYQLVLDDAKLAVAHAGLLPEYVGRRSARVNQFCLYGETSGETDEYGLPVRHNWAQRYDGKTRVVYGHTPVVEASWLNNTVNVDTGCVFGGSLTALRYPELEIVSQPSITTHYDPVRPAQPTAAPEDGRDQEHFNLNLNDTALAGAIITEHAGTVRITSEHTAAALEVMSRFALDPRWIPYLPPTISPCDTSTLPDILEHPAQALDYYAQQGVSEVICEQKHMGSRGIIFIANSPDTIQERLGIESQLPGVAYTRTGRNFFTDPDAEREFIRRVHRAVIQAGIFNTLGSSWVILDTEIMPWSYKAQGLLRSQYASTGAAASLNLAASRDAIFQAQDRALQPADAARLQEISAAYRMRQDSVETYREAYRSYCWDVASISDIRVAPFHVMASEGAVHNLRPHDWHLAFAQALHNTDPNLFTVTDAIAVNPRNSRDVNIATQWWRSITAAGSEGMVVKPMEFTAYHKGWLVQPAVKCRGPHYLSIIYGPEYNLPEHLPRLKRRNLRTKQSLARREFALGIEGLKRFANGEPLSSYHQCVFAVLALESEPVDPRL